MLWGVACLPLAWVVNLHLLRVHGWMQIGHWPIPSLDDPKCIGIDGHTIVTWLWFRALTYLPFALILALVADALTRRRHARRRLHPVVPVFVYMMCVVTQHVLLDVDPGGAWAWFLD